MAPCNDELADDGKTKGLRASENELHIYILFLRLAFAMTLHMRLPGS